MTTVKTPRKKKTAVASPSAGRTDDPLTLREIQDRFQQAILSGDDGILATVMDNSRTGRDILFGVYRNAYVGRLVEIIGNDHEMLHTYLGDDGFGKMARAYIAAHPSRSQNARWVSRHIPDFLRAAPSYAAYPEIAELATIEQMLANAFDAPDSAPIDLAALAAIPPDRWGAVVFKPHPSAQRFALATNALDLWRALRDEATPPAPARRTEPEHIIVWRQDVSPKIRPMGPEEAMMWNEMTKGANFGVLCELAATYDDPSNAALRAAQVLRGWLDFGMLSSLAEI